MIAVSVDPLQGVDPEENTGQGIQQIVVEKGLLQVSVKILKNSESILKLLNNIKIKLYVNTLNFQSFPGLNICSRNGNPS